MSKFYILAPVSEFDTPVLLPLSTLSAALTAKISFMERAATPAGSYSVHCRLEIVLKGQSLCLSSRSQVEGVQRYGPMWKASFGPILTVHVADPALIEQVLRQEGQHPMRSDLSSWKDYRKLRGHHYGLLTS